MRESCLVYCYSGIQSLFEVVLLYTFYTGARISLDANGGVASKPRSRSESRSQFFYVIGKGAIWSLSEVFPAYLVLIQAEKNQLPGSCVTVRSYEPPARVKNQGSRM